MSFTWIVRKTDRKPPATSYVISSLAGTHNILAPSGLQLAPGLGLGLPAGGLTDIAQPTIGSEGGAGGWHTQSATATGAATSQKQGSAPITLGTPSSGLYTLIRTETDVGSAATGAALATAYLPTTGGAVQAPAVATTPDGTMTGTPAADIPAAPTFVSTLPEAGPVPVSTGTDFPGNTGAPSPSFPVATAAPAVGQVQTSTTANTSAQATASSTPTTAATLDAALPPPAGYSTSQLIFEDTFTSAALDTTKWNPWMGEDTYGRWSDRGALPSPYSAENAGGYQVQYNDPYPYGYGTDTTGSHLGGGSGVLREIATPSGYFSNLGYSWASGAISSYGKTYLPAEGGYLQISAKMPDSRYGAWPSLWLMPTAGSDGKEFDLQEGGTYGTTGSSTANNILASHWWGGSATQHTVDTGIDLSADYHTYGVEYRPGQSWTVYLDGTQMFTWTDGVSTNAAYEVIIELEMAGPSAAGWHTVADPINHPGPFELAVNDVQIYSLADAPPPPPPPSSGLTLAPASDSGVLGDNITNVTRPTIMGQGVAGDVVKLFSGASQVGTTIVQTNGSWSVATSTLISGVNNLTAIETDAVGNVIATSAELNLTIDTTPAAVTEWLVRDTGRSSSDLITSKSAVTGGGDPNATVTITEGTTTLGTTTADSSGTWTFTPTLADGSHTLVASETDVAGNTGAASLTFSLDTKAPFHKSTVSLTAGSAATTTWPPLQFYDNLSGPALTTYTIVTGPTYGTLLLNGAPTSTFTQNDIDNNRVTYRETVAGASGDSFQFTVSDAAGNQTLVQQYDFSVPVCYCRGTLILTDKGEVAVEDLAIGDRVMTLSGAARPVRWIGQRAYDGRFVAGNRAILPIRVTAGALADGVPARDLLVSPGHALYIDGMLVQAEQLVNGATITQETGVGWLEYFHIELDTHDIIIADGAPAESYVDCDNRGRFHNAADFALLYPDDDRPHWQYCALLLEWGSEESNTIRAALLERAAALGHRLDLDPDLHLVVDGAVVRPVGVEGCLYRFAIPAGSTAASLASRGTVPAEVEAAARDLRRLGVPVERLILYDGDLRIEAGHGYARLTDGFHDDEATHRWTDGLARLPENWLSAFPAAFTLEVQLIPSELPYRLPPPARAAASPSADGRRFPSSGGAASWDRADRLDRQPNAGVG